MKEEYDERSNGRDSQTKVIYNQLIEWFFRLFSIDFLSKWWYLIICRTIIGFKFLMRGKIFRFCSDGFRTDIPKNMNLKKHFKRRLSSSKRNSLLNPELTSAENVIPNCPIQPVIGHFDHQTDEPATSPAISPAIVGDITPNTDTDNVETVIQ